MGNQSLKSTDCSFIIKKVRIKRTFELLIATFIQNPILQKGIRGRTFLPFKP